MSIYTKQKQTQRYRKQTTGYQRGEGRGVASQGYDIAAAVAAKLFQSCPTLCDPRDGSPPGSPVPDILHVRTLEWVAISFSNA